MRCFYRNIFCLFALFLSACGSNGGSDDSSSPNPSTGLTNVGYAPFNLTADQFNCNAFLEASQVVNHLHIAFLYNTFGNNFSCLEQLLADSRLETLEVNLINEPGHRNGRLGSYEFLADVGSVEDYDAKLRNQDPSLKQKFVEYVAPLQDVLKNMDSDTQLLINPGLESNVSDAAGATLVLWTRELFPSARVVWNPLNPSPSRLTPSTADLLEGHGSTPNISAPCVYNMDGTDVSYPNRPALGENNHVEGRPKNWVQSGAPLFQLIEELANRCEVALIWSAEGNGLDYRSSGFVDPRSRNHSISLEVYKTIFEDVAKVQADGVVYTNESFSPDITESTCSMVSDSFTDGAKTGNLLKQSEFRDRGGVIILPSSSRASDVKIEKDGLIIDSYNSDGSYKDGRLLFRSSISPTTYPMNVYLTYNSPAGKICYRLSNPRVRLD